MPRAYLLVEFDSAQASNMLALLRSVSLGNCLMVAEQLFTNEIIAHLHCTELPDVTKAVVEDIARLEGVKRTTMLALIKEP
jgi:hypothetical protein